MQILSLGCSSAVTKVPAASEQEHRPSSSHAGLSTPSIHRQLHQLTKHKINELFLQKYLCLVGNIPSLVLSGFTKPALNPSCSHRGKVSVICHSQRLLPTDHWVWSKQIKFLVNYVSQVDRQITNQPHSHAWQSFWLAGYVLVHRSLFLRLLEKEVKWFLFHHTWPVQELVLWATFKQAAWIQRFSWIPNYLNWYLGFC